MSIDESTKKRVFSNIDRDEMIQLTMDLTDIESPTGKEREIANYILNWFEENGIYPIKQVIETDRFNAVGMLRGPGSGPSLTLNGHIDTVFQDPRKIIEKSYVKGSAIYGNEIANMRNGLASILTTAKAIKKAGVQLKGDLIVAAVAGEICTGTVDQFQGPQDRGCGFGTWHLLSHGIQSDYAIVTDGSDFTIVRVQSGASFFKITTEGAALYTPLTKRTQSSKESQNSVVKMAAVIDILENWAREYEQKNVYKISDDQFEPMVAICAIQGGMPLTTEEGWRGPFRPSITPPNCELYLDVRLNPDTPPLKVKHELEGLLGRLPFKCELEMFRSQKGYEGKGPEVDYLYSVVEKSYENVFKSKPPQPQPHNYGLWTDTNLYWELGIPAVKWGPSEKNQYPGRRAVEIEGLINAAKTYSLIALEVCGVT